MACAFLSQNKFLPSSNLFLPSSNLFTKLSSISGMRIQRWRRTSMGTRVTCTRKVRCNAAGGFGVGEQCYPPTQASPPIFPPNAFHIPLSPFGHSQKKKDTRANTFSTNNARVQSTKRSRSSLLPVTTAFVDLLLSGRREKILEKPPYLPEDI